eukprot:1186265-Amphidinium_carterae.1
MPQAWPPVGNSGVKKMTGLARAICLSLHNRLGCRLPHQHPLRYWIPEFAARSLNRYAVGDDGMIAEQLRAGRSLHRLLDKRYW